MCVNLDGWSRPRVGDRLERGVPAGRARRVAGEGLGELLGSAGIERTSSTTLSVPSVSVPVLSRQTTSTAARDSTALSCWASAPRRAMRIAATAYVRLVRRMRPSGRLTTAATERGTASSRSNSSCQMATPSSSASGTITTTRAIRSLLSASSSESARMAEPPGFSCDPLRVALGTDRRDDVRRGTLDRERTRTHLVAHRA